MYYRLEIKVKKKENFFFKKQLRTEREKFWSSAGKNRRKR